MCMNDCDFTRHRVVKLVTGVKVKLITQWLGCILCTCCMCSNSRKTIVLMFTKFRLVQRSADLSFTCYRISLSPCGNNATPEHVPRDIAVRRSRRFFCVFSPPPP
uniref:Uncharacterized protein n=1 Tax=Anopheles quadriannulatus TaxID=34691 RepID=A0A182XST6_ANOQN